MAVAYKQLAPHGQSLAICALNCRCPKQHDLAGTAHVGKFSPLASVGTLGQKASHPKDQQSDVVPGGAGFLGSHFCDRLQANSHDVICVDDFFTRHQAQHRSSDSASAIRDRQRKRHARPTKWISARCSLRARAATLDVRAGNQKDFARVRTDASMLGILPSVGVGAPWRSRTSVNRRAAPAVTVGRLEARMTTLRHLRTDREPVPARLGSILPVARPPHQGSTVRARTRRSLTHPRFEIPACRAALGQGDTGEKRG